MHCRDYAHNDALDRYSEAGIDDEETEELSAAARRAAERKMAQRDRAERGGRKGARAAQRSHAPAFLDSDNDMDDEDGDELGIANMKKRTRKQYDERRDADDLDGVDNVSSRAIPAIWLFIRVHIQEIPLEQLSDIKAKSIVEWIAHDRVRRSIVRHFRQFLMSYVDERGDSVYGNRIHQ